MICASVDEALQPLIIQLANGHLACRDGTSQSVALHAGAGCRSNRPRTESGGGGRAEIVHLWSGNVNLAAAAHDASRQPGIPSDPSQTAAAEPFSNPSPFAYAVYSYIARPYDIPE